MAREVCLFGNTIGIQPLVLLFFRATIHGRSTPRPCPCDVLSPQENRGKCGLTSLAE